MQALPKGSLDAHASRNSTCFVYTYDGANSWERGAGALDASEKTSIANSTVTITTWSRTRSKTLTAARWRPRARG